MQDGDTRAHVVRYYQEELKARGPVTFELGEAGDDQVEILDFQILADLPEIEVKRPTQSEQSVPQSIELKRATANKLLKLFTNGVDAVMDKLGQDVDDEESEEDGKESSDEEKEESKGKNV